MTKDFILFNLYFAFVFSLFLCHTDLSFFRSSEYFFCTTTTTTAAALLQNRIYMRYARNLLYLCYNIYMPQNRIKHFTIQTMMKEVENGTVNRPNKSDKV